MQKKLKRKKVRLSPATISAGPGPDSGSGSGGRTPAGAGLRLIPSPFCNLNIESAFHLFAKCLKLIKLWEVLDETTQVCFGGLCTYSFKRDRFKMCNFSFVESKIQKSHENIILYINSIVNHNIWKMRNDIFHEGETFELEKLMNKIIATCRSRKNFENVEERLTSCRKIEFLNEYYIALCSIKDAMFDPG